MCACARMLCCLCRRPGSAEMQTRLPVWQAMDAAALALASYHTLDLLCWVACCLCPGLVLIQSRCLHWQVPGRGCGGAGAGVHCCAGRRRGARRRGAGGGRRGWRRRRIPCGAAARAAGAHGGRRGTGAPLHKCLVQAGVLDWAVRQRRRCCARSWRSRRAAPHVCAPCFVGPCGLCRDRQQAQARGTGWRC